MILFDYIKSNNKQIFSESKQVLKKSKQNLTIK